jgi:hypothetical protein
MVYDSHLDEIVMVAQLNGPNLATWLFNGKRWQEFHPEVSPPAGVVYLAYDGATGDIILVSANRTDVVWLFNGKNWAEGPPLPTLVKFLPAAIAYDPALRSVIAIGSSTTGNFETLILAKKAWDPLQTSGHAPALRPTDINLAMTFDRRLNEMVLYYGDLTPPLVDQTWLLRAKDWVLAHTPSNPSVRKLASLASWDAQGDVALFGGVGETTFYNDFWRFTGDGWVRAS